MPRRDADPFAGYNFKLEIDGITKAGFSECTGLNGSVKPIDYREGNEPIRPRKLPGQNEFGAVTLKRGVTTDLDLFTWHKFAMDGDINRVATMSIVLMDEGLHEKVRWNLLQAWPSKYTGPDLKAGANEIAIESVEIVHEGIERQ